MTGVQTCALPIYLRKFLQDATLYLQINDGTYDTDDKKIGFVLSLLNGDASTWKGQFLDSRRGVDDTFHLGTYDDFIDEIKADFKDVDAKADALYELRGIQQGSNTVETHNSEFKLLIRQSGLDPGIIKIS